MRSSRRTFAAATAVVVWLACTIPLSGCVVAETIGRPRSQTGVRGYVASEKYARIELDESRSSTRGLLASRVVAPVDGFVVVTTSDSSGGSDMVVGVASVKRGESTDVRIPLSNVMGLAATATFYVDKGTKGTLDSSMMDLTGSWDRPVFVNGTALSAGAKLQELGVPVQAGRAVLDVFDQETTGIVTLVHVVAPGPSWAVAFADENGSPGRVLGSVSVNATDALNLTVPLADASYRGSVFVVLLSDRGVRGVLEYDRYASVATAPDQPYVVGGEELVKNVGLR